MIELRDYQRAALLKASAAIASGRRAPLLVCPTGGGKTAMGARAAFEHLRTPGNRVFWAAHRRELVTQAARTLEAHGLDVGHSGLRASAPVQVASVQTVLARGEAPPATMIVLDEAHHFAADEWAALPRIYPAAVRLGLSATPERADGRGLGGPGLFDELITVAQLSELIAAGHLVPTHVIGPKVKLRPNAIAQHPVDAYLQHALGRRAVVFASNVKSAKEYAAAFTARGGRCAAVWGTMRSDDRDDVLHRFERGLLDVVCNVAVLTEGWDCPPADVCILARGCGSVGLYIQMVGRVKRSHPGKLDSLLIDLRGVVHAPGFGMPDEDREYALDGEAIRRKGVAPGDRFCPTCKALLVGDSCTECGHVSESVSMTITGDELERLSLPARMASAPPDKRVAMLARFMTIGRAKGHKPQAALFKYKGTFGHFPPRDVIEAAKARIA